MYVWMRNDNRESNENKQYIAVLNTKHCMIIIVMIIQTNVNQDKHEARHRKRKRKEVFYYAIPNDIPTLVVH